MQVEAFYDRYPYPPPVGDLDAYRLKWQDRERRRVDFHLFWPTRPYCEDFSILVAGCGTSQAAKYAIRWPAAQVTGIDLSTTSIQHTAALKEKYRLENLHLHHLAVEQAEELGTRFDRVVCTGVLHHLHDPDAGLRALQRVLKPHGALHLMVYAPYGRAGIYMMQKFCRLVGVYAPDVDIRDLLLALRALPPGHPLTNLLRDTPDFRSEAGLADALLHPQDRAFTVAELFTYLRSNELIFGRWIRQAPYRFDVGLMTRIPQAWRLGQMALEDRYAAVELFRGNMTRHNAVAYRADTTAPEIRFDDDAWLGYVPIRVPDTLTIREQLPAGIAAILVNRVHAHTDICLPLRPHELRLLEAVDGTRRIGDLLPNDAARDAACSLFERLWWHDQVVFDASGQNA